MVIIMRKNMLVYANVPNYFSAFDTLENRAILTISRVINVVLRSKIVIRKQNVFAIVLTHIYDRTNDVSDDC